jgi:hypothetical protein
MKRLKSFFFRWTIGWVEEIQAAAWDRQIERDVKAGRFDRIVEEIKREKAAGKLIDFP